MQHDSNPALIEDVLNRILAPLTREAQPNLSQLRLALRDLDALRLNVKMNGYALARRLAAELPPPEPGGPVMMALRSKPSTQSDLESAWARHWLAELGLPLVFHRKLWEYAYVLQALWQTGKLIPGMRGLGFGCGTEPLPSLFAARGIAAVVTDLAPEEQSATGWTGTGQHAHSAEAVFCPSLVGRQAFDALVSHRYVDMRRIPPDLRGFDFCWSICALEHLGSIREGLAFIRSALDTLKPGGVAVHTTEYNFLSDDSTIDNWPTVLFLRSHFEALTAEIMSAGHTVAPLDFDVGDKPLDLFIDVPPYQNDWSAYQNRVWPAPAHLKLSIDGFASTCFGLLITKAA
jgi:SAM-dependent methyltransferase